MLSHSVGGYDGGMPLDLMGVHAKLGWARHHFNAVNTEITAWLNTDPYHLTFHRNQQFTKFWVTVHARGDKPDFERWSLMVGDCVTNLRDSLDHLIFAIAQLPTSPKPEKRGLAAFIIRNHPREFSKDAKGRLCSVPEPILDAVRCFQPFNRPCAPLPPLLGVLGELANGNKHKLLSLMMTTFSQYDVKFVGEGTMHHNATFDIYKGNLDDGRVALIFELPTPNPTLNLDKDSKISLHVSLPHKPCDGNTAFDADRTAYRPLLDLIFAEVELVIETITKLV
jgi:hypothetical protein